MFSSLEAVVSDHGSKRNGVQSVMRFFGWSLAAELAELRELPHKAQQYLDVNEELLEYLNEVLLVCSTRQLVFLFLSKLSF